ncbi:uncharacterized protein K452DRAFT_326812 [Aplosporella prunicola CBS 121167]|uniref:Protein kinase domain-containing protein n=1 Tax=Aplosporella prunicola CBS 121167 TaxID=1176127 RepID=A0A6A6BGR4_9PEZI|nr:uncharacterized protein K452DRAFT_326812 [Aplosporella prunicola CBS 121167]KAF2141731.1 hypothetical protein K452DRAFT_326812 [Aplosporella prunicola CBS 121167]
MAVSPAEPPADARDLSEALNDEIRSRYIKTDRLGEGTYAVVFKATVAGRPGESVAIKKIKVNAEYRDGIAMDAIREIKHLQELAHPNIIKLHAVFSSKAQNLNLVLELLPLGDLEDLMKAADSVHYGAADIKAWMGMACRGMWWCHANFVLHRDIKLNNLLIAADGEVKLADFGLARSFADPYTHMTANVITRWYRPPELLYQARHYGGAVDIWSLGIVFGELTQRRFWLPGETDLAQIDLIAQTFGSPTDDVWPGVSKLDGYVAPARVLPPQPQAYWEQFFGLIGPDGIALLRGMLRLDPRRRLNARQVLENPWWTAYPRPTPKEDLPNPKKTRAEQERKMAEDLKKRGGELPGQDTNMGLNRGDKVARRLFA